jgi:hypothetical protein
MKKNMLITMAMLIAIAFAACKKSANAPAEIPKVKTTEQSQKVYEYIIGLGFFAHTIVEHADEFIVEEDIIFPKNMQVPDGKLTTEQYYTGSLVTAAKVANIRLKIDPSMSSMSAEITSAINQWNAVASCNINWVVSTGTFDVTITDFNLGSGICGQGTFPSGGSAGNLIRINKAYIAGNSFAQRARTICHEMGHNVSFRHTNWAAIGESSATPIPGSGTTDAASLMNGGQCGSGATVLSARDQSAAATLY